VEPAPGPPPAGCHSHDDGGALHLLDAAQCVPAFVLTLRPVAAPAPAEAAEPEACTICMEGALTAAFVPCGHRFCAPCAAQLTAGAVRRCPICRGDVRLVQRLF
jgi:hypothetical protein